MSDHRSHLATYSIGYGSSGWGRSGYVWSTRKAVVLNRRGIVAAHPPHSRKSRSIRILSRKGRHQSSPIRIFCYQPSPLMRRHPAPCRRSCSTRNSVPIRCSSAQLAGASGRRPTAARPGRRSTTSNAFRCPRSASPRCLLPAWRSTLPIERVIFVA